MPLRLRVRCRRRGVGNERSGASIVRPGTWRQRLIRSLLYGRNVDRSAKRAPASDLHTGIRGDLCGDRRTPDHVCIGAIATARVGVRHRTPSQPRGRISSIVRRGARHRRQGAQPVRRAAPDHRQGRSDRASDCDAAGSRHRRSARPAVRQERLRLLKREITPQQQLEFIASAFPASASCARTSASIPPARSRAI